MLMRFNNKAKPIAARVVYVPPLLRVGNNPKMVTPDTTPLYVKRGWKKKDNTYTGYYRTRHGAFKGKIERRGDKFYVFIHKPPVSQLQKHSRWVCFHERGRNRYEIHLAKKPVDGDISSIIFYVEQLIIESYRMR